MMRRHPRRGIAGANIQHFFDMSKEMSIILKIEAEYTGLGFGYTRKSPLMSDRKISGAGIYVYNVSNCTQLR